MKYVKLFEEWTQMYESFTFNPGSEFPVGILDENDYKPNEFFEIYLKLIYLGYFSKYNEEPFKSELIDLKGTRSKLFKETTGDTIIKKSDKSIEIDNISIKTLSAEDFKNYTNDGGLVTIDSSKEVYDSVLANKELINQKFDAFIKQLKIIILMNNNDKSVFNQIKQDNIKELLEYLKGLKVVMDSNNLSFLFQSMNQAFVSLKKII